MSKAYNRVYDWKSNDEYKIDNLEDPLTKSLSQELVKISSIRIGLKLFKF